MKLQVRPTYHLRSFATLRMTEFIANAFLCLAAATLQILILRLIQMSVRHHIALSDPKILQIRSAAPLVLDIKLPCSQRFRDWAYVWQPGLRPSQ